MKSLSFILFLKWKDTLASIVLNRFPSCVLTIIQWIGIIMESSISLCAWYGSTICTIVVCLCGICQAGHVPKVRSGSSLYTPMSGFQFIHLSLNSNLLSTPGALLYSEGRSLDNMDIWNNGVHCICSVRGYRFSGLERLLEIYTERYKLSTSDWG